MATDNFNRPDNNALGPNWEAYKFEESGIRILSNQLRMECGADRGYALWVADNFSSNHYSQLTFVYPSVGSGTNGRSGVSVRASGTTISAYTAYAASYHPSLSKLFLTKFVGENLLGPGTLLAEIPLTLVPGNVMRLAAVGSVITLTVDGVNRATVTDSEITTGRPAIHLGWTGSTGDGWLWDNWEGDSVPTFPVWPPPTGWQESLEWSAITREYDRVVRHVRRRTPVPLRVVRLSYTGLSPAEFAILRTFYETVRGRAKRFLFTHPITGETYRAKFGDDRLAWGVRQALGPRIDVVITVKEAP